MARRVARHPRTGHAPLVALRRDLRCHLLLQRLGCRIAPATSRPVDQGTATAPWGVHPGCRARRPLVMQAGSYQTRADDRLGVDPVLVEPGLVRQEAVGVRVDELDELERRAAVPGRGRREQRPPLGEVDGREPAAQLVVEEADELDADRDLGPAGAQLADEADQAAGLHRLEPEHDDVGEADVGREADRVRVAGARRVAAWDRARRARWRSRPSRSSSRSSRRAGCGSRGAPHRRPYRYRLRRLHVPVPAVSQVAGVPPARHRRDRDDGEPRLLAAAPARRAPGAQRRHREPRRPAARADRPTCSPPAPTPTTCAGVPVTAAGRYLPDEQLVVVNRSQHGLAGEIVVTPLQLADGRIVLVSRGFVPLDQPSAAGARRRRRRHGPAAAEPAAQHRAGSATRRRAT